MFAQGVATEIYEGLGGLRDVAVFFPCETDIDEEGDFEWNGLDAGCVFEHHVKQERDANAARDESLDGDDLVGFEHDVRRDALFLELAENGLTQEGTFLEHDDIGRGNVFFREAILGGERAVFWHAGDNLARSHWQELQVVRGAGDDDDAEIKLIALELFANRHGALLVQVDVEVGVFFLEAGEDFREKIGAHHRGDANLDCAFLELLVVVDLEDSVLASLSLNFTYFLIL